MKKKLLAVKALKVLKASVNNFRQLSGDLIEISQASYAVQVMSNVSVEKNSLCGGSIIAPRVILTAAHCMLNISPKNVLVRVGTKFLNLGGDIHRVKRVVSHPAYDKDYKDFDVSLLFLVRAINLKTDVKEVSQVAKRDEIVEDNTLAFINGWGLTMNKNESNKLLRGVVIPTINQEVCTAAYPKIMSDAKLCAGFNFGQKRTCIGLGNFDGFLRFFGRLLYF